MHIIMTIILFSVASGLFPKSSCAQAGLLLGVLLQHGGDDDELRGVRHAGVPPLLLLHRQIPHHGHHHPWGGPPSGTTILEIFWSLSNSGNQVATLVSITLAIFGLDASNLKVFILEIIISFLFLFIHIDSWWFKIHDSNLKADRVISKLQSPSLLTGFLRFAFYRKLLHIREEWFLLLMLNVDYNWLIMNCRDNIRLCPGSARPALASGPVCLGLSQCWARLVSCPTQTSKKYCTAMC